MLPLPNNVLIVLVPLTLSSPPFCCCIVSPSFPDTTLEKQFVFFVVFFPIYDNFCKMQPLSKTRLVLFFFFRDVKRFFFFCEEFLNGSACVGEFFVLSQLVRIRYILHRNNANTLDKPKWSITNQKACSLSSPHFFRGDIRYFGDKSPTRLQKTKRNICLGTKDNNTYLSK